MKNIYEQHQAAFANVKAYVVMKGAERVATIAFKYPKDGAGRLYAYVQWAKNAGIELDYYSPYNFPAWFGMPMARGVANGYGYDKKSAAVEDAAHVLGKQCQATPAIVTKEREDWNNFIKALGNIGGSNWDRKLEDAGFTVLQAV